MTVSLCNEIAKTNYVTLLTSRSGPLSSFLEQGIVLRVLEAASLYIFAFRCVQYCKRHGVDIIVSNIWPLTVYVQAFKVLAFRGSRHLPIEHSPHNIELQRCRLFRRYFLVMLSRFVYRGVEHSFVVSSSISTGMQRIGFHPRRITQIDVPIFIPKVTKFRDPKHITRPRFLTVAKNKPEKNLTLGLRLLKRLKSLGFDFEWWVVGGGVTELEGLLCSDFAEIHGQVFLVEERVDLDAFYRRSDFFLSTSLSEGKPLALIEALSYGLGVVSTPSTPALIDILSHPGTGYISADFTEEALCSSLVKLINADSMNLKLKRRSIALRYSPENVAADLFRKFDGTN